MLGVTLLEVMLVLAIAAMIIVMSIRYYTTAQNNQQANGALSLIQGIVAAADQLAAGTGVYSGVATTAVQSLMPPNNGMKTPWGTDTTVASTATVVTITLPAATNSICALLATKVNAISKLSTAVTAATCPAAPTNFVVTYTP